MRAGDRRRLRRGRLAAQGLAPALGDAAGPVGALDVVRRVGALQAQDHASGMWSLGVRSGLPVAALDRAVLDREIVRTWPMRGTLHWVPAEDARWMCRLFAAPHSAALATRHAQIGLTRADLDLAGRLFEEHLATPTSRPAVAALLAEHGIDPTGQRAYHVIGHHCMTGLLCQGPLEGRQPTFVLLDAWVPSSRGPGREEGLATAAERYVRGHGPVTEHDLAGWFAQPLRVAREALALVADRLVREEVDGQVWITHVEAPDPGGHAGVQLLPQWDELLLGYRSRDLTLPPEQVRRVVPGRNGVFRPTLVVDGEVAGTWRRAARGGRTLVEVEPFGTLPASARRGVERAATAYARFLGTEVELRLATAGEA